VLRRTLRWIEDQTAFLTVLLVLATAFVYLIFEPGHWGRGSGVVSVAMLLAGLFRVTLPTSRAGMLAARGRWLDSLVYLALGGAILVVDIRLHS
jgi:hypothetical protein